MMPFNMPDKARSVMEATVNVFHHRADNIGDRMCGPAQYFWPDKVRNVGFRYSLSKPENAILGGGQVFDQVAKTAEHARSDPAGALVAWGVGIPQKNWRDETVRQVVESFALFGTRNYDWKDELDFVPCASCMSPVFDTLPEPRHEMVVFAHRKKTPLLAAPEGIPFMTNVNSPAAEVLSFLAQGETVVTSSYHGAYWAQLLGRKVVCIPYNSKFQTLQHPVTLAEEQNWQKALPAASRVDPLLEPYREINRAFARRVADLWGWDAA